MAFPPNGQNIIGHNNIRFVQIHSGNRCDDQNLLFIFQNINGKLTKALRQLKVENTSAELVARQIGRHFDRVTATMGIGLKLTDAVTT